MSQQERKAKAVIAAAIRFRNESRLTTEADQFVVELTTAVDQYEAVKAAEPPADPNAFHCPHCGAERPPYGWHFNIGDTGPFALQWITCFCGECKATLGVSVVQFLPKQELVEQLKAQFAGKINLV